LFIIMNIKPCENYKIEMIETKRSALYNRQ
jgi:hypothetical protein